MSALHLSVWSIWSSCYPSCRRRWNTPRCPICRCWSTFLCLIGWCWKSRCWNTRRCELGTTLGREVNILLGAELGCNAGTELGYNVSAALGVALGAVLGCKLQTYCCCKKHNEQTGKHSRQGQKTSYQCSTCMVPLCYSPRYGEDSCAQLFHEVEAANDPCVSGCEVRVREHKNKAAPPSRKRHAVDLPNSRSKSSAISSPRRVRPKKDSENCRLTFT